MSSTKVCLVLFAAILAFQMVESQFRFARSPDKVEMELPDYSAEREDQDKEFNDQREDEEAYWQGEGERVQEKYENMEEERKNTREQNEERYESDKQHLEEQEETYDREAEENYNKNKGNFEEHHKSNEDHFNEQMNRNNSNRGNETADEFRDEANAKGGRYGEKGSEYMSEREEDMENFEMEGKGPSFSYQQD